MASAYPLSFPVFRVRRIFWIFPLLRFANNFLCSLLERTFILRWTGFLIKSLQNKIRFSHEHFSTQIHTDFHDQINFLHIPQFVFSIRFLAETSIARMMTFSSLASSQLFLWASRQDAWTSLPILIPRLALLRIN